MVGRIAPSPWLCRMVTVAHKQGCSGSPRAVGWPSIDELGSLGARFAGETARRSRAPRGRATAPGGRRGAPGDPRGQVHPPVGDPVRRDDRVDGGAGRRGARGAVGRHRPGGERLDDRRAPGRVPRRSGIRSTATGQVERAIVDGPDRRPGRGRGRLPRPRPKKPGRSCVSARRPAGAPRRGHPAGTPWYNTRRSVIRPGFGMIAAPVPAGACEPEWPTCGASRAIPSASPLRVWTVDATLRARGRVPCPKPNITRYATGGFAHEDQTRVAFSVGASRSRIATKASSSSSGGDSRRLA